MVGYPLHLVVEIRIQQVFSCVMHLPHTFPQFEELPHGIRQLLIENLRGNNLISNLEHYLERDHQNIGSSSQYLNKNLILESSLNQKQFSSLFFELQVIYFGFLIL